MRKTSKSMLLGLLITLTLAKITKSYQCTAYCTDCVDTNFCRTCYKREVVPVGGGAQLNCTTQPLPTSEHCLIADGKPARGASQAMPGPTQPLLTTTVSKASSETAHLLLLPRRLPSQRLQPLHLCWQHQTLHSELQGGFLHRYTRSVLL